MEIVKVSGIDLKPLECSAIKEERYHHCPLVVINEKNEILFGEDWGTSPFTDSEGNVTCIRIPSTEIESKNLSFDLHYLGMTGIVDCENFNNMPKERTGAPYDLYLWNAEQFEQKVAAKAQLKSHTKSKDDQLF